MLEGLDKSAILTCGQTWFDHQLNWSVSVSDRVAQW